MPDSTHPNYRLQDLQRRWERDPSSRVYQQLAEEYRKAGQLVEAAVVLEDGLGRRPNDIAARVALGRCRLDLGQTPEAIEALENVLARDAAHHVANKLLLDAYLRAGDLVQARERLNIYRLLNDRDPELEHLGFRLQQLAEGSPGAAGSPEAREPQAPWASLERESVEEAPAVEATETEMEIENPEMESESAAVGSMITDAPDVESTAVDAAAVDTADVFPSLAGPQEEALNMASPTHSKGSKANDVFDLGVVHQESDGFAALWAELGYSLTPPSPGLGEDLSASGPSPLFDGAEPPEESEDAAAPQPVAPQPVAPQPATDDLTSNPFGQLMAPAAEETPAAETADIWQVIASQQGTQPAAPEPSSEPQAAFEAPIDEEVAPSTPTPSVEAEPSVALADGPTLPLADLQQPEASIDAASEDPSDESDVSEQVALEDEETRPLLLETEKAPEMASAERDGSEPAQSPWEAAMQATMASAETEAAELVATQPAAPQPVAPEPVSPEPAAPEPAAPEPAAPEPVALVPETEAHERVEADEPEAPAQVVEAVAEDVIEEEAEATVTLGSLYLKQGHREEAARIFEKILRRSPGNQAALAGLNLARKSEMSSLSAMDLLADQSLSGDIPADVHAKKILVLSNYLQHLKAHRRESHVH